MARKFLRYLVFFLCTLVLLFVLVTLILPSTGRVVKEAFIPVGKKVILAQLTNMGNYGSWYPWIQMDPAAKVTIGADGNSLSWKGIGKEITGSYKIGSLVADTSLPFTLNYGSVPPISGAYMLRVSPDGKGTTVVWYMNMKAGWTPWWRFYAAMLNKLTGPVMEAGLTNLKMLSQQADSYSGISIKDTIIAKTLLATAADTVLPGKQYDALSDLFSRLQNFIRLKQLSVDGHPQAQFQVLNDSALKIRAAIPVSHSFLSERVFVPVSRPAEHILYADFQGRYKELQAVYKALSQAALRYTSANSAPMWETYENSIIPQSDTEYCQVRVCYPLRKQR